MSNEMEKRYSWTEKQPDEPVFDNSFVLKDKSGGIFNSPALLPEDDLQAGLKQKKEVKGFEFVNRGKMLEDGEYTYKDGSKNKKATRQVREGSSMQAVVNSLKHLDELLNSEIQFDEKSRESMRDAFLKVCSACETYILKKNPWTAEGKARKQMVKDFFEQVSWESMRFEQILDSYKGREGELAGATWLSVLSDVRTETFKDGEDGVKIEMGGAGTSDVYIIEKNGEKKYFKETEGIPSKEYAVLLNEKFEEFEKEEITGDTEEERTKNQNIHDRRVVLLKAMKRALNVNYASYDHLKSDFRLRHRKEKMAELVVELHVREYIEEDKGEEYIASIDEILADNEFLADYLFSLRKSRTLAGIATSDAKINKNETITKRNAATARLAKVLGLEDLIVGSKMTEIEVNGKKKRGILMDEAKGVNLYEFSKAKKKENPKVKITYSAKAIKQLTSLQILDIICGQVDRNIGNYLAEIVEVGKDTYEVKKITGIDNDMSFGRLKYSAIFDEGSLGYNKLKNMEDEGEGLTLPGIDMDLALNICAIQPEILAFQMCDILSVEERAALIDRLKGVQKAIKNQQKAEENGNIKIKDSKFVQGDAGWEKKKTELMNLVEKASPKCLKIEKYSYLYLQFISEYAAKNPEVKAAIENK